MKIFGLVITTQKKLNATLKNAFKEGFDRGENVIHKLNFGWINPVIHDLEKLRKNTWDQDKITHIQNWLKGAVKGDV